jgi:hypothetical protein
VIRNLLDHDSASASLPSNSDPQSNLSFSSGRKGSRVVVAQVTACAWSGSAACQLIGAPKTVTLRYLFAENYTSARDASTLSHAVCGEKFRKVFRSPTVREG